MRDVLESIKNSADEVADRKRAKKKDIKAYKPAKVDVRKIREKTGLTQEKFAATFGISLGTLRHWERGDRAPHGPALVLLNAIGKEPVTVLKILESRRRVD